MQADIFQCSSCFESFDLELRIPKFLISCPHSVCLKCLIDIFLNYLPQERQCPSCNINLQSTFNVPEDFPTNPTLIQLLQNRPKPKAEFKDHKERILKSNGHEDLPYENIRKKIKTEQEIDDELGDLQELIMGQFTQMRKMLHSSQNAEIPIKIEGDVLPHVENERKQTSESTMTERNQDEENEDVIEISSKLKGIFTEAQQVLNKFLKKSRFVKSESVQENNVFLSRIEQEEEEPKPDLSPEQEEEIIKIPLKTNTFNIFSNLDCGGKYAVFTPSMVSIEDEEEQDSDELSNSFENKIQEQILKMETESQLKISLSNQDISEEIFNSLCSQDFWNRTAKDKITHLEVNFSASSLTDYQFTKFAQIIFPNIENLISISLNLAKTKISKDSIKIMSQRYLKNYKLKSFKLDCSRTSIGDEGIKYIDDGLSWSVETLESVEIILDSNDLQGEKFLDVLMGMSQLKHLRLSFENSQISAEVVTSVVFCLHFLAQGLESLDLNFKGTDMCDEGFESFSDQTVSQMNKLKHFKLSLGDTFVSEDFLLSFFQSLGLIAFQLETLELDLHFTELYNTTFKQFCEDVLTEMQNLESLKLDLSQTKITDVSLKSLVLPANKLKSLALNLSENKIHDAGLQSFKENNNFKNIQDIDLQIAQTGVSDKALKNFLSSVKKGNNDTKPPKKGSDSSIPKPPRKENDSIVPRRSKKKSSMLFSDTEEFPEKELKPKKKRKESAARKFDFESKVYAELKKELISHYNRKQDPARLSAHRAGRLMRDLEPSVRDNILRKILRKVLQVSDVSETELEKWRETIQTRIGTRLEINSQNPRKYAKRKSKKDKKEKKEKKQQASSNIENTEINSDPMNIEEIPNNSSSESKQDEGEKNHLNEVLSQNKPVENMMHSGNSLLCE